MTTNNKHTAPYTASDIEKYRKGELSASEMHDLEQTALDDPFLADAIEGFTTLPPSQQDLTDLRERLSRKLTNDAGRTRRHATVILIRRRITIAAAIILLLGIGSYTFIHYRTAHRPAQENFIAVRAATEPRHSAIETPHPAAANNTRNKDTLTSNTRNKDTITTDVARNRGRATLRTFKSNATPNATFYAQSKTTDSIIAQIHPPASSATSPLADSIHVIAGLEKEKNAGLDLDSKSFRSYQPAPASALVLNGKVLDPQDHPLAGVYLAVNGNHGLGTTTDNNGFFKMSLQPRDSTRLLSVSLIGYDHTSLAVNTLSMANATNNIIHLKPSTTNLDEVVVVGYGAHRKEREAEAPSDSDEKLDTLWTNAAPVIGRQAYLQYLNIAKKKLGLDSTITGTETVSFIVDRNGSLSGFKIEQSLSPAHDVGALRLVTDGPAWHLLRGKKIRASVTVNFP
jgi:hypothetical protein